MTRGSVLSDRRVIEVLNRDFVALELDLTTTEIPDTPAFAALRLAYEHRWRHQFGFVIVAVTDPTGRVPLGVAGDPSVANYARATQYHPERFLTWLEMTDQHVALYRRIRDDRALSAVQRRQRLETLVAKSMGLPAAVLAWFEEHHAPDLYVVARR